MMRALVLAACFGVVGARVDDTKGEAAKVEPAKVDSAKDELLALAKQLATMKNYTYRFTPDVKAAEEAPAPAAPGHSKIKEPRDSWLVQLTEEGPLHYVKGRAEFWRDGRKIVALSRADAWELLEGTGRSRAEAADSATRAMARVAGEAERILHPHKFLVDAAQSATKIDRAAAGSGKSADEVGYVATLAPKAVQRLMRSGAPAKKAKGSEAPAPAEPPPAGTPPNGEPQGGAPSAAADIGVMRVFAVAGKVVRIELDVTGGAGADGEAHSMRRRYELSEFGTTKPKVPRPALEALASEDEEEEPAADEGDGSESDDGGK
jgi:hypothetical protein